MRSTYWKIILTAVLLTSASAWAEDWLELTAGMHKIRAEVVNTPATRAQGLMERKELPGNQGMLFVFPQAQIYCMWMRNTLIPLSVAFIDDEGEIINIEDMQPQTDTHHCANAPVRFALEMSKGWFERRGLASGRLLKGLKQAPVGY